MIGCYVLQDLVGGANGGGWVEPYERIKVCVDREMVVLGTCVSTGKGVFRIFD